MVRRLVDPLTPCNGPIHLTRDVLLRRFLRIIMTRTGKAGTGRMADQRDLDPSDKEAKARRKGPGTVWGEDHG